MKITPPAAGTCPEFQYTVRLAWTSHHPFLAMATEMVSIWGSDAIKIENIPRISFETA